MYQGIGAKFLFLTQSKSREKQRKAEKGLLTKRKRGKREKRDWELGRLHMD